MDILDQKTDKELMQSVLAECAKAKNEVVEAEDDIKKIKSRLSFLIVLANKLIDRQE